MWLNPLPNGALQLTVDGVVVVLREEDQRALGKELCKRGIVTIDDVYDPYHDNEFERLGRKD